MSRSSHSRIARALLAVVLSLTLTFSPNVFALGPLERNHPLVEEGMEAYDKGDYETALQKFTEAQKVLPQSAALEFNRANALHKLERYDEAATAYENAQKLAQGSKEQEPLKGRDFYNMGNNYAALGKNDEAIKVYRKALRADPNDLQARHNLEVLLRKIKPPPPKPGQDGGTPDGGQDGGQKDGGTPQRDGGSDAGRPDGGQDGGADGGNTPDGGADAGMDGGQGDAGVDGGQGDGGQGDGGQNGDGGTDGGTDGGEGKGDGKGEKGDGGTDGGQTSPEPDEGGMDAGVEVLPDGGTVGMSEEDAEKLLDAMKQNEKNLQLWRFQQKRPRKQNDKDW